MATPQLKPLSLEDHIKNQSPESPFYVDIDSNLTHASFKDDLDRVLEHAKNSGVQRIIVTGTSLEVTEEALQLAKAHDKFIRSTAGYHPHDSKLWTTESYNHLKQLVLNNPTHIVAIGECGLDYNRDFSPRDIQRAVFESHVKLAIELNKPLFIHEREASHDLIAILSKFKGQLTRAVIHCFTGTVEECREYLKLGLYIGITGFIWKDRSSNGIKKILEDKLIPLDRILINSDSPFMYPNVNKLPKDIKSCLTERSLESLKSCNFKRNEPSAVPVIVEMVAAYMKLSANELAIQTSLNAIQFFDLN